MAVDYRIDGGGLISELVGETDGTPNASGGGLGCTLVKRSISKKLKPMVSDRHQYGLQDKKILNIPSKYGGQDLYFFYTLRQKGITVKMMPDYEANHLRCRELNRIRITTALSHRRHTIGGL